MRRIGMILIGLGIVTLVYSGFKFTTKEKIVDVGPIQIDKEKEHEVNWPPMTGALLLTGGIVLMVLDKRK